MSGLMERWRDERGIAVTQLALAATVLMLMAAFAVDLGWFFVNSNRVQRAAEAGALAGVVWMPDDEPVAIDRAERAVRANGYDATFSGQSVVVVPKPGGVENRLRVQVTDNVDTFFLRIIGRDTQTITKEATAEFVRPLAMGSPSSRFGNDATDGVDCAFDPVTNPDPDPCFWANLHGKHTNTGFGDAFSSYCAYGSASGNQLCTESRDHARRSGRWYTYGITPQNSSGFRVWLQNPQFEQGGNDNKRAGDHNDWCPSCPGPTTIFRLNEPDATPLVNTDNTQICSRSFAPGPAPADLTEYSWVDMCGVIAPVPGTYTLEVFIPDSSVGVEAGLNRYSIRATSTAGSPPTVNGLGDMSIFNNSPGGVTNFTLAEVPDYYAGRTLFIELYDPGDAAGGNTITLLGPDGNPWPTCNVTMWTNDQPSWEPRDVWPAIPAVGDPDTSDCEINADRNQIPAGLYDGDWIRMRVDLPTTYTCGPCWWSIEYDYTSSVQDTTTWRAYIAGAPVRLVLGG